MNEDKPKQMATKIRSELEPFLDGIRTKHANFELFKQAYTDFRKKDLRAQRVCDFIMKDFSKISKFQAKEEIHSLFAYLGVIESLGNNIVDMIVMLLVANGRDFHIECQHTTPRIKHVVSIKDLERERVPLTTKLNFLKDNGILELTSIIDSKLRNAIAHLKFDVKENSIYIKGKPASKIIGINLRKMIKGYLVTHVELALLAEDKGLTKKERIGLV